MKFKFISFLMFSCAILTNNGSYAAIVEESTVIPGWDTGGIFDDIGYIKQCPDRRMYDGYPIDIKIVGVVAGRKERYYPRSESDCTGYKFCANCREDIMYPLPEFYKCFCNAGYRVVNQDTNMCGCTVCPKDTYSETISTSTTCTACPQHRGMTSTSYTDHNSLADCKYLEQCPAGEYGYKRIDVPNGGCKKCPVALVDVNGKEWYGTNSPPLNPNTTNNTYDISSCKIGGSSSIEYRDTAGIYTVETPCSGR
ncbi:hypothetical protein LJC18_05055 [Lachnospiraceae bacterium OttesenSCG-928-E19]|nr:hypothetical protein [Lachnospiraceae bacterium OttesenSCG-928-E19]